MTRSSLLGCPVDSLSLSETVDSVIDRIRRGERIQHCVVNTFKFLLMHKDPALKKIVHQCAIVNADGQSAVWALRLLGRPIKERVTGIDLMEALVERAAREKLGVYFYGSYPEVVRSVVEIYRARHPELRIAGFHHGYSRRKTDDPLAAVRDIQKTRPDILFVALDSPRKEFWLAEHLPLLKVPFSMGVGGSFDVVAGLIPRAPRWMQNAGLEWFWRLSRDPRRMWKRYLKSHTLFAWLILTEILKSLAWGRPRPPGAKVRV